MSLSAGAADPNIAVVEYRGLSRKKLLQLQLPHLLTMLDDLPQSVQVPLPSTAKIQAVTEEVSVGGDKEATWKVYCPYRFAYSREYYRHHEDDYCQTLVTNLVSSARLETRRLQVVFAFPKH